MVQATRSELGPKPPLGHGQKRKGYAAVGQFRLKVREKSEDERKQIQAGPGFKVQVSFET